MQFTTSEIAKAVGTGTAGPEVVTSGVATDSREVTGGELFVPLQGQRDGHDFIGAALAAGAAAYLTERPPVGGTAVVVPSAAAALCELARLARQALDVDTVGITGSVGKTTTKDMVAAVLASDRPVHASRKSFNNSIGVPSTILNAPSGTRALVVELGANHVGEIAGLCRIACPTIGVVTRVAPAHTEGFGGIEGVVQAKGELVEALPPAGVAVLNADDERVMGMAARCGASFMTFGRSEGADVKLVAVVTGEDLRPRVELATPWGPLVTVLSARGAHQAYNAAAAAAVAGVLGVPMARVGEALAVAELSGMRMDLLVAPAGYRVLDDSYNASPAAVQAALEALVAVPGRRRVAVLGHMAELGELSAGEHRNVAARASELGVEVLAVGTAEYGAAPMVPDVTSALDRLGDLGPGDIVLVKGSRAAGLDALVRLLVQAAGPARATGSVASAGRGRRDRA